MQPHSLSDRPGNNRVIVVGSGPSGSAATLLLTRAGVDVTLLEAGLPHAAWGFTARIGGMTIARVHRSLPLRSNDISVSGDPGSLVYEDLAPGGLTNHWSCAVPRFSRDDFADARRAGEAYTWPVEYDDLAPWYDWVEPHLRITGADVDLPQLPAGKVADVCALGPSWKLVADAAHRAGQALVPVPYVYGAKTTLTLSGTVFNSFVRLVKPLRRSRHLTIRFGARVTRLEWSPTHRSVDAVVVRDVRSGAVERIPCRAVILAAGAINTAKILLQSTHSDFPDGLGNTDGVLGRYLHDHPLGKVELELSSPMPFKPAACLTRLPLVDSPPLYAAACLQWSGASLLTRSVISGHPRRLPTCGFNIFATMAPTERNFVALDTAHPSNDGTPGLVLNISHPPQSTELLIAARDQLVNLFDQAKLHPRVNMWSINPVGSAVHYAGTCRMHASPKFGMLDRWSRLHSVKNVVVADSAAFTTGPEKNPALTAMALAARASHRLIDDLRSGII